MFIKKSWLAFLPLTFSVSFLFSSLSSIFVPLHSIHPFSIRRSCSSHPLSIFFFLFPLTVSFFFLFSRLISCLLFNLRFLFPLIIFFLSTYFPSHLFPSSSTHDIFASHFISSLHPPFFFLFILPNSLLTSSKYVFLPPFLFIYFFLISTMCFFLPVFVSFPPLNSSHFLHSVTQFISSLLLFLIIYSSSPSSLSPLILLIFFLSLL